MRSTQFSKSKPVPEACELELVEQHELLAAHRGLLDQLAEAGVVLLRGEVHHPRQPGQEAGEAVLHLLGYTVRG